MSDTADTVINLESMAAQLHDLTARKDIYAVVCQYMRGQDRLLPELHLQAFHPDAQVDCGFFTGAASGFVDFAQEFLGNLESSHHIIGQADIHVDGNSARGEIYFLAQHRIQDQGRDADLFVAGRYLDRYEDRGDGWRIASRREVIDWVRTDPASDSFLRENPILIVGSRGVDG